MLFTGALHLPMKPRLPPILLPSILLALTGGCARYEYDLVRPPDLSRHVGARQWESVPLDEL